MKRIGVIYSVIIALVLSPVAFAAETSLSPQAQPSGNLPCHPFIKVEKTGPPIVRNGDTATFTIFVRNLSQCEITGLTVVDSLPSIFTVTNEDPGSTSIVVGNPVTTVTWAGLTIPPGDFIELTLETVVVSPTNFPQKELNKACASVVGSHPGPQICDFLKIDIVPPAAPIPSDAGGLL